MTPFSLEGAAGTHEVGGGMRVSLQASRAGGAIGAHGTRPRGYTASGRAQRAPPPARAYGDWRHVYLLPQGEGVPAGGWWDEGEPAGQHQHPATGYFLTAGAAAAGAGAASQPITISTCGISAFSLAAPSGVTLVCQTYRCFRFVR